MASLDRLSAKTVRLFSKKLDISVDGKQVWRNFSLV